MKRLKFLCFVIFLFVGSMFVVSAQESSEWDVWAKENVAYYMKQPRSVLVQLPFLKQQALYSQLSPKQQASLWQYKFKDIKESQMLSDDEKAELKRFYKFARPKYFDLNNTEALERYKLEAESFKMTMKKQYDWTDKEFFAYCECFMTEDEIREYCKIYNLKVTDFLRTE